MKGRKGKHEGTLCIYRYRYCTFPSISLYLYSFCNALFKITKFKLKKEGRHLKWAPYLFKACGHFKDCEKVWQGPSQNCFFRWGQNPKWLPWNVELQWLLEAVGRTQYLSSWCGKKWQKGNF